ncbi:hypothetical protein Vretimale_7801 [Volvox reticuliferus]|uniref:Uncharacterized protein n=1 Tax=Volvox reticuliferus TaxID=1737510 RepID=A0A8J4G9Z7_9CHLO|nr:hypothetical protein Vretimale_7801 [Volvox reticuliferus]
MNVSAIGCHRPWSRNNLFHASLFRNFLYCPGSLLDGAITCLETTSQADCVANAACTWTNQTFVQTGSSNSSVQMMNIIYNTIIYSIGWHKGPLLTMFANGITKPPSYCAARWTVNQTFLESLYGNYNDSLKWYMNKYPTSAAALVWPEGKALTGNCTAGSKFTSWASLCTNATTELACPSSKFWFYKTGVGCTWNGTTNACRAGAMVTDNIMFLKDGAVDPWVATVMNMETLCSHGDSLSNCSNYGIPFTYDTARLGNLSQITVQLEDVQSTAAGQSSGLRVGLMVVLMQLVVTAMLSTNIGNAVLAPAMV